MPEKESKKGKVRFEVTEVATQTGPAIRDNETEEVLDVHIAICKILNELTDLKKQLV